MMTKSDILLLLMTILACIHQLQGCDLQMVCKGSKKIKPLTSLPIRPFKGRPGINGTRGDPGKPGLPGFPGRNGELTPKPKLAFLVAMKGDDTGNRDEDRLIKFDTVITNIGNFYSEDEGTITIHQQGIYNFVLHNKTPIGNKGAIQIKIQRPNNDTPEIVKTQSGESTSSADVFLDLEPKTVVSLYQLKSPLCCSRGELYTTFSGYLVHLK